MPSCSQTAISSGAGGLWAVRRAFTPLLFISCICRISASKRTADPTAPSVACRSTPWIFRYCPLSENPAAGSNAVYRMPNGVLTLSAAAPPTDRSVRAEYRCGWLVDHSAGLVTFRLTVAVWVCPAGTLTVVVPWAAVLPSGPVRVTATCTDAAADPSFEIWVAMWGVGWGGV